MPTSRPITVEVVFASPQTQRLETVSVPAGSMLSAALAACGILQDLPQGTGHDLSFGIWGQLVDEDHALNDGDRVEIYRPLLIDPKKARRQLATAGLTMRGKPSDE